MIFFFIIFPGKRVCLKMIVCSLHVNEESFYLKGQYVTLFLLHFGPKDENLHFWSKNLYFIYMCWYLTISNNNVNFGLKWYETKMKYCHKIKSHQKPVCVFEFKKRKFYFLSHQYFLQNSKTCFFQIRSFFLFS